MMTQNSVRVTSFDGTEAVTGSVARPERYRDLPKLLARGPVIARGAGLSYSAASMGERCVSVDMTRFDRILAFDRTSGEVTVEAGARIGALTEFLVAQGFYLPVLPGYPTITVGGSVGFDVHGKSQVHSGNFGEWVLRLRLIHPDHGELVLSRAERPELFDLTLGGFGLTGLITEVTLRTQPLPGRAVEIETLAVQNLGEAVEVMRRRVADVDGLYSWHDLNQRARFGAGVVFVERFQANGSRPSRPPRRSIQARAKFSLWNRLSTPLALGGYAALQRLKSRRSLGIRQAMFPIEGLELYYFAFGARGFREYQLIVPAAGWDAFVVDLEHSVRRHSPDITLASLKLFRGARRQLAFAGDGVCLAVDVPADEKALAFFSALDELAVKHGACVNLSKDSRVSAELCRAVFPGYDAFRSSLAAFDPARRFQSRLRERIDV